jgi:Hint module
MNEPSCLIDICSLRVPIAPHTVGNGTEKAHGIDISNKNILFQCDGDCSSKRCILDGSSTSRLFYGSYTNITLVNFMLVNGYHPNEGGSIKLVNKSIATMINTSFVNNSAPLGSAIYVNDSQFIMSGSQTSMINNTGRGPSLHGLFSKFNINNAVFSGTQVSEYDAELFLLESKIDVHDVHFLNATRSTPIINNTIDEECHVYVATDINDFTNGYSCLKFNKSSRSVPLVDLSDQCPPVAPLPPPISAPIPTSPSPSCFSRHNMVNVKDVGNVPMNLLRIGDFVKSRNDTYTQVYGFGHFNHQQASTFLRITLFHAENNHRTQQTISKIPNYLEISPAHLLMMEKNNRQYRIPAAHVRVGDRISGQTIQTIQRQDGVYAPLTQSGELLVNDILVSNYVNLLDDDYSIPSLLLSFFGWDQHTIAHTLFTPQRYFCYYNMKICQNELYINNGYGLLTYLIISSTFLIQTIISQFALFPFRNF